MKILVIEDHPKLRENIVKYFHLKGYTAEWAIHGKEWIDKAKKTQYDCIILDVNLPVLDGKDFAKLLREKGDSTPILALTSNTMLDDKLEMFSLWVDDYLTKPFELAELEARVLALSRRKTKHIEQDIVIGDVAINFSKKQVLVWEKKVELGNKEFLIVEFLAKNRWYPKSKMQIVEYVWWERESTLSFESVTLEAHISYIRKKLGHWFIKTIKGVGYVIQ